jgi:hypothetical protein
MRARPPMLLIATAAVLTVSVGGGEARMYGASAATPQTPHISHDVSLLQAMMPPDWSLRAPSAALDGLSSRIEQATNDAAAYGATISVAVLDRASNQLVSNGNDQLTAIASVAKLFIADDVLSQGAQGTEGNRQLPSRDRQALDIMLRSSDDDAAETFWNERGGETIIAEVARRYGLTSTAPPSDGRWWNTTSSASDLVRYYDMLLNGSGGLSLQQAEIIVDDLAESTATGIDGYPQRFGIPDGLYAEPVAVKQGWMCCIGSDWMHLSTGVIGYDRRYIMVVESLQPSDDATARATITRAVKTMFPSGRI